MVNKWEIITNTDVVSNLHSAVYLPPFGSWVGLCVGDFVGQSASEQNQSPVFVQVHTVHPSFSRRASPSLYGCLLCVQVGSSVHGAGTHDTSPFSKHVQLLQKNIVFSMNVSLALRSLFPCWHLNSGPIVWHSASVQVTDPPMPQVQELHPSPFGKILPIV